MHYATLGICPSNQPTQTYPFSLLLRVIFGFLLFGYLIVSQCVYTFYVANGFIEYVECICTTFSSIIVFVFFAAIVFRKTELFEIIENIESLIDTSEPFLNYTVRHS